MKNNNTSGEFHGHDDTADNEADALSSVPARGGLQAVMVWLYERAVSGIAGAESAGALAEHYLREANGNIDQAARDMIHRESFKAGSSGFLSGIGGIVALPLTLPFNITSVLFIQTRLVAAIACLGGHRLTDERIRILTGLCLCGNAAKALLQELAIKMMEPWKPAITRHVVEKTLVLMATRTGMGAGQQFVRLIPLAGGLVSGAVDITTTRTVGRLACRTFLNTPADLSVPGN